MSTIQISLSGEILNISNIIKNKNGEESLFIDVLQKYKYNGKEQEYIAPIKLKGELLDKYLDNLIEGTQVSIRGLINTEKDNNDEIITYIKGTELQILNHNKEKGVEI